MSDTEPKAGKGKKPDAAETPAARGDTPPQLITVEVTAPVDHDGVRYAPGEALTATPAQAAALIAAGAAKAG
jgi:hypothetical protein